MKIRSGFVSNSSTTSFCIYGTHVEDRELLTKKMFKKHGVADTEDVYGEKFDELVTEAGLEEHIGYDGSDTYLGVSLRHMDDNQTFGDFKKNTKEKIQTFLGKKTVKCEIHEEAWRDG
jgi:hypothetical protein